MNSYATPIAFPTSDGCHPAFPKDNTTYPTYMKLVAVVILVVIALLAMGIVSMCCKQKKREAALTETELGAGDYSRMERGSGLFGSDFVRMT